jgi:signal transduction histidine kinase
MSPEMARLLCNALPANLISMLSALIFLGEDQKVWPRMLLLSMAYGVFTWATFLALPQVDTIRTLLNIFGFVTLYRYGAKLHWLDSAKYYVVLFVFGFIPEAAGMFTLGAIWKLPLTRIDYDPFVMPWLIPFYLAGVAIAFPAVRLRPVVIFFFTSLRENISEPQFKAISLAIAVQLALLIALVTEYTGFHENDTLLRTVTTHIAFMLLIIFNIFVLNRYRLLTEEKLLSASQDAISASLTDLLNTVRGQRHDFVNQLQIISSLAHQDNQELTGYISRLVNEAVLYNQVLKSDNSIISALLNAKLAQAELRGIRLDVDIDAPLSHLGARALYLSRILGNLIDNAIEFVEQTGQERWVKVIVRNDKPFLSFSVVNPGSLPTETQKKVFDPGFTTKDGRHSGLGLHICRQLAWKLHGEIECCADQAEIMFRLVLPGD